jgi:dihydrodipicolinate synthase/N-acetylneuraminate lyase
MKPLAASEIHGNWATLLLPINDDDSIDFARLADEIDAIVTAKVNGVYSNGTAGEFYAQTEDEFDRVSELLANRCEAAKLPFQIGLSHTSAQTALARLERTKALKPAAFQVILPDWFPLVDDEAIAFLSRMAERAGDIGLILYNPPHAKRVLDGATMRLIAERVPGVIGAKVGNVDAAWFEALGPMREKLSIFTPGHFLATHFAFGSKGAYSNVACISPAGAQRWYDQMRVDLPAARAFNKRLLDVFAAHVTPYITHKKYPNAAVDKLLATAGGWANVGTRLRWPYRSIPLDHGVALGQIFRSQLPELFD